MLLTEPLVLGMATVPLLAVVVVVLSLSVVMVMGASGDDVTELVVNLQSDDQRPNTQQCAGKKCVFAGAFAANHHNAKVG